MEEVLVPELILTDHQKIINKTFEQIIKSLELIADSEQLLKRLKARNHENNSISSCENNV